MAQRKRCGSAKNSSVTIGKKTANDRELKSMTLKPRPAPRRLRTLCAAAHTVPALQRRRIGKRKDRCKRASEGPGGLTSCSTSLSHRCEKLQRKGLVTEVTSPVATLIVPWSSV